MNILKYILPLIILLSVSCVKEKLYDPIVVKKPNSEDTIPPIPPPSTYLLVNIDWENVENKKIDEDFEVMINQQNISLSVGMQLDTLPIDPNNYDIFIYNKPTGIVFNDEIASMNTDGEGNMISPLSDAFFSGSVNITADTGDVTHADIKPVQRMRNLKIIIYNIPIFDSVTVLSGKLTNVARSFNMITGKEKNPDSISFNLMDTCGINLFGFIGTTHMLEIKTISFGTMVHTEKVDISSYLNDFNTDKTQPKVIAIDYADIDSSVPPKVPVSPKTRDKGSKNYNNKISSFPLENSRKICLPVK